MSNMKEAYSEISAFLNILDIEYVKKIPKKLIEFFEKEKSNEYFPQYTLDIPIKKQSFKKETLELIAWLYLNYWYENDENKLELTKIYMNNDLKFEMESREKYNPDNIFKNNQNVSKPTQTQMIEYKDSLFKRLFNKIKSLFKTK